MIDTKEFIPINKKSKSLLIAFYTSVTIILSAFLAYLIMKNGIFMSSTRGIAFLTLLYCIYALILTFNQSELGYNEEYFRIKGKNSDELIPLKNINELYYTKGIRLPVIFFGYKTYEGKDARVKFRWKFLEGKSAEFIDFIKKQNPKVKVRKIHWTKMLNKQ